MANINKKQMVKNMTGMQMDPRSMSMAQGPDDIQASIVSPEGQEIAPAALKEGEIVFSIPAIIGAGQGDYDKGAEFIMALHDKLKALGEQMLQENSLGSQEME